MSAIPREVPRLAVEEFFGAPSRVGASISPDGTRIAYLAPWRERLNVWVESVDAEDEEARCVTADENRSVLAYHWSDDPRWLLYEQGGDGEENWHLYRVDLENPEAGAVDLTPSPGVTVMDCETTVTRPGKAILSVNRRNPADFDLCELDIATGELTVLAQNPGHVAGWLCTPGGGLFAQTWTDDGDIELARWDTGTETLRPVATFDGGECPLGIQPIQLTPDGTGVWLGSGRGADRTRLVRLDLATGEETVVDSHPTLDLDARSAVFPTLASPFIRDRYTGELIGVRYLGGRQVIHALDPHFAAVLENLEMLSEGDLSDVSSDAGGQRWVVSFTHDRDPGVTYYYDHTTGHSRLLFRSFPHLDPGVLAPMTPVTIPSRDGLDLPSYLTLPPGTEPAGLPMVLLVHGGPGARDHWGFNPVVQLLANRGYAVLQVNFRGSTGFGKAFLEAGTGEPAGKTHGDLIDAVEWAVDQGYADRDRVAVFGGSHGGYAALIGVTFTPDVFAAAIDLCGISNLVAFLRTVPEFATPQPAGNQHLFAGNPDGPEQKADMPARSPVSPVGKSRTPLMVVQGRNDVRVVKAEAEQIIDVLRTRGVEVEYVVKDNEGHGFANPANTIDIYRAADRFLARHLGGRPDTE
ncbi:MULTISPECIES: S9 family peptidase [unclassified Streptomyces]|uniref:S9 family peptidase n=1 Tax=unclassified Streptomyces TaxID=2593676 RepID=UPI002DD95509|nr:S9 family peptidase [Streptomyces sp. NBC_01795]WSA90380.1 S9 family peptidase [Streptomyces sp. NBC_01795]WSS45752.1 S9 family peptidase [Streptomyces sp. NBC_01187]